MGEERVEVPPLDELDDPEVDSGARGKGAGRWKACLAVEGEGGAEDPFPRPRYQGFLSLSVGAEVLIYWMGGSGMRSKEDVARGRIGEEG